MLTLLIQAKQQVKELNLFFAMMELHHIDSKVAMYENNVKTKNARTWRSDCETMFSQSQLVTHSSLVQTLCHF